MLQFWLCGAWGKGSACITHSCWEAWPRQLHPTPTFSIPRSFHTRQQHVPSTSPALGSLFRLSLMVVWVSLHREWVIELSTCKPLDGWIRASLLHKSRLPPPHSPPLEKQPPFRLPECCWGLSLPWASKQVASVLVQPLLSLGAGILPRSSPFRHSEGCAV